MNLLNRTKCFSTNRLRGFPRPHPQCHPLCPSTRLCRSISDENWIRIGLDRVLQESPSGRGFLQRHSPQLPVSPTISHYFHSLRSERRLRLLEEISERICSQRVFGKLDPEEE